jgi:hypothetical protein
MKGEQTVLCPLKAPVIFRGVCVMPSPSFLLTLDKVKDDRQHTAPNF